MLLRLLLSVSLLIPNPGCNKVTNRELLFFHAGYCAPCKRAEPVVKDLGKAGVKVVWIDVEKYPNITRKYSVTSIPLFVITDNGVEKARTQNLITLKGWKNWLLGF
jgi:thiol-disulfide isomerase/thioredoxin